MRNLDLDVLEMVQAVVTHGGVVRAAQALHRVPSNLTTRIKQLEERLGVALFARRGRGMVATAEGRLLFGYAERLLRLAHEAESALGAGRAMGTFRLGALESTAGSRLPPILSRYNRLHPQVCVELITGTTGALIARLAAHDLEAAFVSEPFTAPGLESRPVFREELVLISGQGVAPIRSARDVGRGTVIAFSTGCSYRRRLEDWLGAAGVVPERVLELGSYPAIVACVAAGTGVAIVPRSVLAALNAAAEVRQHPLPPALESNRTHLLSHPGQRSRALQALDGMLPCAEMPPAPVA
jgi:DNA-binding transcriptional LysR family regulator